MRVTCKRRGTGGFEHHYRLAANASAVTSLASLCKTRNDYGMAEAFIDPSDARAQRPRAADVAALAGVSESAVSRTFRGGSVSAHVRARVQAAARKVGYRPNAMASAVITRRSNLIAVLMTTNTNSHFPEVLSQLSHAAAAANLRVMLFTIDSPDDVPSAIDQILSYQVDGVISLTDVPMPDARLLADNGVELLLYNRSSADYPANLVSCDHRAAGRVLGQHLIDLGHRHFGLIDGPRFSILAIDRARGVLDAVTAAGLDAGAVPRAIGNFGYDSGRDAARKILSENPAVTAIVGINDLMAIGAIDEANSRGLHIPRDVAIAGFDGIDAANWDRYRLTTMVQPLPQLTAAAIGTIQSRLATPHLAHEARLLTCHLRVGNSTTDSR